MDELQQSVSLAIFPTVLGHAGENDFRMGAQDGKLDVQCGVEHSVGSLLIGEYPLILSFTDVIPLGNGLLRSKGAFVVVANDAAQQAVVACGNPVVVVE